MRISILLLTSVLSLLEIFVVKAEICDIVVEEASLGIDPRDRAATEVFIDVYRCETTTKEMPLVVFACGGGVPKSAYGAFALGLAKYGYVIAVIEHMISFGPSPPTNFANALDVANTIAYIEDQTFEVDMTKIVLMGHSFGSGVVLNSINEQCLFPWCQNPDVSYPQGITVPRHQGIVLAAAYGGSLNDRSGGFSSLRNLDIPYGIINGDGDINYFLEVGGENLTAGTFDRLYATKVIATIDNLDHFSISEVNTSPDRGDIPSTLPLDEQISLVTDAMELWLRKNLKENPTTSFCSQMLGRFVLADCLEEYA